METTVKQRLLLYLKEKGLGQNKFEKIAGISNGYISHLKSSPSSDILMKILNASPDLNREWLMMGVGDMLLSQDIVPATNDDGIPYYDVENFECGSPAGFGGALEVTKPDGYFQFPWLKPDGNTWCVRAHGNSMLNRADPSHSICHGAWVAMRRSNVRAIQWGEVYALATADGYIIKKLLPSDHDGMIRCVSFNEEDGYLPFDLSVSEIYDYAIIVGVATINLW